MSFWGQDPPAKVLIVLLFVAVVALGDSLSDWQDCQCFWLFFFFFFSFQAFLEVSPLLEYWETGAFDSWGLDLGSSTFRCFIRWPWVLVLATNGQLPRKQCWSVLQA